MRRVLLAAALCVGVVGCGDRSTGGGDHHQGCSGPGTCTTGNYCALTDDGNVCWPDVVAPDVRGVVVECSTSPCRRDAVLVVTATVEDESATGRAWVELDVDPGTRWEMAAVSGSTFRAEVALDRGPFPFFEHDVHPAVHAIDEAGNWASTEAGLPVAVTRARWALSLKSGNALALSSPAILPDGRIVLGGSDGKLYFVASDGRSSSSVQVASESFSGPPSVGSDAIWVAGQDGTLHRVTHGGVQVALAGCSTRQPLLGAPAVVGNLAVAGSAGDEMMVAMPYNACSHASSVTTATSPVVVGAGGHVYLGTGSLLRSFTLSDNGVLSEDWRGSGGTPVAPAVGDLLQNAPLVGKGAVIWTIARDGTVSRTNGSDATIVAVAGVSNLSGGGIVLSDDSVVVSESMGFVTRVSVGGTEPWLTSEELQGTPQVGLALDGSTPSILVPTSSGDVYLLDQSDLSTLWTKKLSTLSLQPANVTPNPGNRTSTAYLAGEDGKLYAIVVDGLLDTSAPWPKAFHDPQNTSNAGVVP